jgi:HEAT repeat protein
MRKPTAILFILLALVISAASCAYSHTTTAAATDPSQTEAKQNAAQTNSFIAVEGADLNARLDAALRKARAASMQTPFWSAYSFDVRSGVAIDPGLREFRGSMSNAGDINIFIGTSNGMTVETRNLGVFLLRDAGTGAIKRLEIYNLEKRREYGGYPVYWMGRSGNEESLNFLRALAESGQGSAGSQSSLIAEHATLAVGLHDDPHASQMLKAFIRGAKGTKIRATAVFWLGQIGGETPFLADLVRNEKEDQELRENAAQAIGESRDKLALATLQNLYAEIANREVKHGIIQAVSDNEDRDAAYAFLLKVAKTDSDREAKQQAVQRLGEFERESVITDLMTIYAADRDQEMRSSILHALSEIDNTPAQNKILEIARGNDEPEIRAQAIQLLGEKDTEATVDELMKVYDAERNTEVREQILHAFSEMSNQRAEDKLFEIARRSDSREMRQQAIHWIGERAGQRSLALLGETANSSSADTEVQMEAVHAISERPAEEAIPLLIKIAKTHPSSEVRQSAIQSLGESEDPRAVEFFKEVLGK